MKKFFILIPLLILGHIILTIEAVNAVCSFLNSTIFLEGAFRFLSILIIIVVDLICLLFNIIIIETFIKQIKDKIKERKVIIYYHERNKIETKIKPHIKAKATLLNKNLICVNCKYSKMNKTIGVCQRKNKKINIAAIYTCKHFDL